MAGELPLRQGRTEADQRGEQTEHNAPARRPLAAVAAPSSGAATLDTPPAPVASVAGEAIQVDTDLQEAAPRRPWRGLPRRITLETGVYLLIGLGAVLSRFFDLGRQAQHHDESLHSYFSWMYYVGMGYTHDPLMHGPFLFHVASLSFLLFGDSDASSRYAAAFFSVATVLLPWFLRRELGRWGALTASVLLLTSPSFLYFGRFHRHDVFSAFWTLLLFIAIIRFVATPRPAWLFTGAAAAGFLFTNKEDFFIVSAIFGSALVLALLWSAARRVIWMGIGFLVVLGLVVKLLPKLLSWPPMPTIPWETPTAELIQGYIAALLGHPVVLAAGLLCVGFLILAIRALSAEAGGRPWAEGLFGYWPAGTPMAAAGVLLRDRRLIATALGIVAGIYVALYTSLFSNIGGIFSGTFGALFYWLGQHDVRRAEQPWYYYLLLLPQYDPLVGILGTVGMVLTGWRLVAHRLLGRAEGPVPFVRGLLAYWALMTVAIYSWAGEKMPWMDIHLVLPLLLLAAALLGTAIERVVARGQVLIESGRGVALPSARADWALLALVLAAAIGWFLGAARLSGSGAADRATSWWVLLLPGVVIAGAALAHGFRYGWSRGGQMTLLALSGALLLYHVHAGWALAYQTGDVPKDMAVYVQTAPDVTRFMDELDEFSALKTGGSNLPILYDDSTSWPFQWYLRNYTNKSFFNCTAGASCTLVDAPAEDVAIVLVGNDNLSSHPELTSMLSNYTPQPYAMRWHYPEDETYRRFAIAPELGPGWSVWKFEEQPHDLKATVGSVLSSLIASATPQGQAYLFRLLAYRELEAPLGSYDFTVFIRKDLVPEYNTIRYR